MVAVTHSIIKGGSAAGVPSSEICAGLNQDDARLVAGALEFAAQSYAGRSLEHGEPVFEHALGNALVLAGLRLDAQTRAAGILFDAPNCLPADTGGNAPSAEPAAAVLAARFGADVAKLVEEVSKVNRLRLITREHAKAGLAGAQRDQSQIEVLRKMLLAMVGDLRVVLIRLASRVQTLRYMAQHVDAELRRQAAHETLDIYAPLANRLGVWQLKWELEDLSFRFLHAELYQQIAQQLDERRVEREAFIEDAIARLSAEVALAGIKAEVVGRPKHLYSIWNKMRAKNVGLDEIYDVRALRVLVDDVKDCYTVLGIVHDIWQPIPKEFDDYISRPKGNLYRSLHTAVTGPDGRGLEVQIRTHDMHRHAELGVAAHWRYKEGAASHKPGVKGGAFDDKIAWLRQVLAWKDEIVGSADWVDKFKRAALDDTVYVLTPQGRVLDLPRGATPIDFAYHLHSDLGHRCRGARVDGHLVPLNTPLANGQRVEIVIAKTGGPSRDWLNPQLGFLHSSRAKTKVRQYFKSLQLEETIAQGRAALEKELQREGQTHANLEALAAKLEFAKPDDLFAAIGRGEVGARQLQLALAAGAPAPDAEEEAVPLHKSRASSQDSGILVVGVDKLMTQLARCCKPAPPDPIGGFVTRGRGVSVHRLACSSFRRLAAAQPERIIAAGWGQRVGVYPADIEVVANDRQGLLRDLTEVLSREKINVTAVKTQSRQHVAYMVFTAEVQDLAQLKRTLALLQDVAGVTSAVRKAGRA
jgi:GTP pyrophosphokinase